MDVVRGISALSSGSYPLSVSPFVSRRPMTSKNTCPTLIFFPRGSISPNNLRAGVFPKTITFLFLSISISLKNSPSTTFHWRAGCHSGETPYIRVVVNSFLLMMRIRFRCRGTTIATPGIARMSSTSCRVILVVLRLRPKKRRPAPE